MDISEPYVRVKESFSHSHTTNLLPQAQTMSLFASTHQTDIEGVEY
jgi:hypothetical protein